MKDTERTIDLRQLVILIMMQWRIIMYATFICIVFGAFIAINSGKNIKNHQDLEGMHEEVGYDSDQSYEYKMSLYKKLKIYYESEIKKHLLRAENENAYIENSLRMKIDPLNQVVATANVLISGVNESKDPIAPYLEKVHSDDFWRPLAEKYSMEAKYFREMCSIGLSEHSLNRLQTMRVTMPDRKITGETLPLSESLPDSQQIAQVTIILPDREMAGDALTLLAGMFEQNGAKLLQKYVYERVDPDLARFQQDTYSRLMQSYNQLHGMYNNYGGLVEPPKKVRPGARKTAGSSGKRALLKGTILGGVAGAGGSAMLIALSLLLSGRLLSFREFFDRYPLNSLAVFPPQASGRHTLALDRQLLQWRDNSRFSRLDRGERFDIAVENIRIHVGEGDNVLLLGTIALPRIQEVQAALADRLTSCTVKAWHFVDQQLASLHEIDQHEHVILVEEAGTSRYQDIDHEIQVLQERDKKIVGCIIV